MIAVPAPAPSAAQPPASTPQRTASAARGEATRSGDAAKPDDGAGSQRFAELLEEASAAPPEAVASTVSVSGDATPSSGGDDPAAATDPAALLALLQLPALPATPTAPAAPTQDASQAAPGRASTLSAAGQAAIDGPLPAGTMATNAATGTANANTAPASASAAASSPMTAIEAATATTAAAASDAPFPATLAPVAEAAAIAPPPRIITPPPAPLALPADPEAGFDDGFGERITWMAGQRLDHARIQVNPEHAGPIDVRVQVEGEHVRAEFQSSHAEVRQAIEASLPRLREMLGQHGLQLAQADVGQRDGRGDAPANPVPAHGEPGHAGDDEAATAPAPQLRRHALVDAYA